MREGEPSSRYAALGVWVHSLGPRAPRLQGERLRIVIYDQDDNIVRRLEDISGEYLDERCELSVAGPDGRPARQRHYLVDIAPDGSQTVLHSRPHALVANLEGWFAFLGAWAAQYGVSQ